MKHTIYIAVVQYPMASLDETLVEVFSTRENAQRWLTEKLADEDNSNGYDEEQMNWEIYEREIYA